MQETLTQISNQLTERWNGLSKRNRILIGVGVIVSIIAIAIVVFTLSRPTMQRLYYENLTTKDISEVVQVLDDAQIPYTVIEGGTNVEINEADYNTAKLALANENIPAGAYTFADALNNTMTTTESERQAKMHQLKESELAQMLMSLDSINHATVELVMPEDTNSFLESNLQSSASVVLSLASPLSDQQAEGISRLIASSVENLALEDITILDTSGNALYAGGVGQVSSSNKQQELKVSAERDIETKIKQLLAPMYDEVRVSPNLVLDFTQYEELREEYVGQPDTGEGLVATESSYSESTTSTGTADGAEPGVAANGGAPVYTVGGANGVIESKVNDTQVTYQNNKIVSNTIKNEGDVDYNNSSIAVNVVREIVYDQNIVEATLTDGMTWEMFKEANKNAQPMIIEEEVIELVRSGTGIDDVAVYGYEQPVFVDEEVYEMTTQQYILIGLVAVILALAIFAFTRFRRQDKLVETEPELEIEEMLTVARESVEADDIEFKEDNETKRQIEKFVDEKPEAVAHLLRNWLLDDDQE